MCEASKFTYLEEKIADTADDFYPSNRKEESSKSAISGLLVCLNSKRTQLRSQEIELASINQKMIELDLQVDKLSIANQYLSNQADAVEAKQAELLQLKSDLSRDLKEWKEATSCMKKELQRSDDEMKERRSYLTSLQKKDQQLRGSIKGKEDQNKDVYSYNLSLDLTIEKNDNQISKRKAERDALAKTALTLETFSKSFKKNIIQKEKELSRAKFDCGDLENALRTKDFERANLGKETEKSDWQSKMYEHHNQQIEKTNLKLKADLEKLVIHLESLRKNNKHLNGCIKEYSETGITAAKKILQIANK